MHRGRRSESSGGGRAPRAALSARMLALAGSGLVTFATVAGACSSSSHSATLLGSKTQQDCTAVSDVLSDGPDPDADPVGYAQAQVLPLEQLKVSDPTLRVAVKNLAAAYQAYGSATGATEHDAAALVTKAGDAVNAMCPGATS